MFKSRFGLLIIVLGFFSLVVATEAWAKKPVPVCGDGRCQGDETTQSCPSDCAATYCGDGICNGDETYDSCGQDCASPAACNNDGTCNQGEDCVSCPGDCSGLTSGKPSARWCCGAANFCDADMCGADCGTPVSTEPFCGDGITDLGEECDDAGETAYCDFDCTYRVCGDGYTNVLSDEECDANGESTGCDIDCTYPRCGDNLLNESAGEECDDGNTISGDGCDEFCSVEVPDPFCGDGNLDSGEECDDGNNTGGDGCDENCFLEPSYSEVPSYQFNIGDSIGEAEAANGTIGSINHETVWSTGFDAGDSVLSLNERFEYTNASAYTANNALDDAIYNRAVSGAVMADFAAQAGEIVSSVSSDAVFDANGMITMLLGNNDVCAPTLESMTDPALFEAQYRAGLNVLAGDAETAFHHIQVSGIPAIYWLWNAKRSNWWCRVLVWPNVPCDNLLSSPADDCASSTSRLDPDSIYTGDGSNCVRRKNFHAKIRDIYNPILRDVLQEYIDDGSLPNARFVDIFDVRFNDAHVNGGDCFHPSEEGHALLSDQEWCRSQWENGTFICTP